MGVWGLKALGIHNRILAIQLLFFQAISTFSRARWPRLQIKSEAFSAFLEAFEPLEAPHVMLLTDYRTNARYCECHIKAKKLIALATTDVPLDPEEQPEYRANREVVEDAPAYERMIDDAKLRRTFSNIVAEYTTEFEKESPLKIIGGQHRFEAIKTALDAGIDEHHGVKVYFDLNMDQRLDVQLISNTNIAISGDLFDRMHETVMGPELRAWCQSVGLLDKGKDFADRRVRGGPISVQLARTFILNYFEGAKVDSKKFESTETTPELCATGQRDDDWEKLRKSNSKLWNDKGLKRAGEQFASLIKAQRAAFTGAKVRVPPDFPDKAMNYAVLASWAYIAGMLRSNDTRLKRHFSLSETKGRDPLNAAALAKGRHKTDPENEFASSLLEEAKRFLEKADAAGDKTSKEAFLHASLLLAFSSLEAHINAISEEFSERPEFSMHEKGLLLEKEVRLQDGAFSLMGLRMSRLEDRILFLYRHFSGKPLDRTLTWWAQLNNAIANRNRLTHPKGVQPVSVQNVRDALSAIIASIDMLYNVIYKKGLPVASLALHSKLDF